MKYADMRLICKRPNEGQVEFEGGKIVNYHL